MRLLILLAFVVLARSVAHACAPAPPLGEEVAIADEEAVIIWDPATKTEHFIRRARFQSTAPSFGFLVPTPTTPQLGEVSDAVFDQLAARIRPNVVVDTSGFDVELGALLFQACALKSDESHMPSGGVRVIQSVNVAGFQATTLEAGDPVAITAWLGEHGYATTPQLTEWLARYVTDKWKITAFVVAKTTAAAAPDVARPRCK